jgi:hypothetical protein
MLDQPKKEGQLLWMRFNVGGLKNTAQFEVGFYSPPQGGVVRFSTIKAQLITENSFGNLKRQVIQAFNTYNRSFTNTLVMDYLST